MKVIAGLGNPGERYVHTPHNVGFDVVDALARRLDGSWKNSSGFKALIARITIAAQPVWLVKPQTFMNLSGTSIVPVLKYYGGEAADLIVVSDDVDLPLGRLRIRGSGGTGGHKGLASVIEQLGNEKFARIRLGVGRDEGGQRETADYVLSKFDAARQIRADEATTVAADAAMYLIEQGLNETMNRYNGWNAVPASNPTPGSEN